MLPVATIGYEKTPQPEVLDRLKSAGVELLIDVRAVASSRRAGFSKTLLAGSLNETGIDYLHLRDLGTPKAGRQAVRAGRIGEMHEIFNAHMATAGAQLALERAIEESLGRKVCLLCYETDPTCCHRTIVARMMTARTGASIKDL